MTAIARPWAAYFSPGYADTPADTPPKPAPAHCLTVPLSCPHCGGLLEVINPPRSNGFESKAVLQCAAKPDVTYLVTARIDAMSAIGWSRNRGA